MYIQQLVSFLLGMAFTILVMAMPTIIQAFKKSKMRTASDGKEYELELNGSWEDDDWDQPIVEEPKKDMRTAYHNTYYHANREKIRARQNAQYAAKLAAEGKTVRSFKKRNLGVSVTEDPVAYKKAHEQVYERPAKKSSLVPPVTVPLITPPTYTYGTRALS